MTEIKPVRNMHNTAGRHTLRVSKLVGRKRKSDVLLPHEEKLLLKLG